MGKFFISKKNPTFLYYADNYNHVIKKINIDLESESIIAGNSNLHGYLDDEVNTLRGSNIILHKPLNILLTNDDYHIYISDNTTFIRHIDNITYDIYTLKFKHDHEPFFFNNIINITISDNNTTLYIIDNYEKIYYTNISNKYDHEYIIFELPLTNTLHFIINMFYKTQYYNNIIYTYLYIATRNNEQTEIIKYDLETKNENIYEKFYISKQIGHINDFTIDEFGEIIYYLFDNNIEWSYLNMTKND